MDPIAAARGTLGPMAAAGGTLGLVRFYVLGL